MCQAGLASPAQLRGSSLCSDSPRLVASRSRTAVWKCLCLILLQMIQSRISGWQASGMADHSSAGPRDAKKTGISMRSASGSGECGQMPGKWLSQPQPRCATCGFQQNHRPAFLHVAWGAPCPWKNMEEMSEKYHGQHTQQPDHLKISSAAWAIREGRGAAWLPHALTALHTPIAALVTGVPGCIFLPGVWLMRRAAL